MNLSANMFNSCKLKNLEIRFPVYKNCSNNRGKLASSSWGQSRRSLDLLLGLFCWTSCLTSGPESLLPLMNKTSQTCKSCRGSVRILVQVFASDLSLEFKRLVSWVHTWTVRIALCLYFGVNLIRPIINTNTSCDWNYCCDILNNISTTFKCVIMKQNSSYFFTILNSLEWKELGSQKYLKYIKITL